MRSSVSAASSASSGEGAGAPSAAAPAASAAASAASAAASTAASASRAAPSFPDPASSAEASKRASMGAGEPLRNKVGVALRATSSSAPPSFESGARPGCFTDAQEDTTNSERERDDSPPEVVAKPPAQKIKAVKLKPKNGMQRRERGGQLMWV